LVELLEDNTDDAVLVTITGLSNLSQNGTDRTGKLVDCCNLHVTYAHSFDNLTTTPAESFEGSIPFTVAVTANDGASSASASHDATLTVNPHADTPVFTAAAPTIHEYTTFPYTTLFRSLVELLEDNTDDAVSVTITGLSNLSQNG